MIRLFRKTDLPVLRRMICDTIDASYSEVYPPRAVNFFKNYHSDEKIIDRSVKGKVLVLFNELDGSIWATGSLIGFEIEGVFVHCDYQRQGYGKIIMAELEKIASSKGLTEIRLCVSLPSRMFYEHLGYKMFSECAIDVGKGQYLKYWPAEKILQA
jgi:GNAT superfamily N-acetyltransferase